MLSYSHLTVGFFRLVQQDDRVGVPPHGLRQLPTLIVADVARRCADQPCHCVLLHINITSCQRIKNAEQNVSCHSSRLVGISAWEP